MQEKSYSIKEIFGPSIQGEGLHSGVLSFFIRFSGCNRQCPFCDTDYNEDTAFNLNFETIKNRLIDLGINDYPNARIVITGGEPLLQADVSLFNKIHYEFKRKADIETNGSIDIKCNRIDTITMSPKQSIKETKLKRVDVIKLLYPYLDENTEEWLAIYPEAKVYLQPVMDLFYNKNVNQTLIEIRRLNRLGIDARLSIQLQQHIMVR